MHCMRLVLCLCRWPRIPRARRIDALSQHIKNLLSPSTPYFFNTLYDPTGRARTPCAATPSA